MLVAIQIEKGALWTFEQEQSLGFSNVTTNTRMTVVKLATGGLWVHAPIAPTKECIRLIEVFQQHLLMPEEQTPRHACQNGVDVTGARCPGGAHSPSYFCLRAQGSLA